jgi:signal transduction histidine kinase
MTGESVASQDARTPLAASADETGIDGLLHDLGHQMMTVSLLAESVQAELPEGEQPETADARRQVALVLQETTRAMTMIAAGVSPGGQAGAAGSGGPQLVDIRALATEVARTGELRHDASVRLLPGGPAYVSADPVLVWRVLSNLTDNAARAAGPGGHVEISITRTTGTVIEVADDGSGFGRGPSGMAGRGLSVVAQLLAATGGELDVAPGRLGVAAVRAIFGGRCDRIVLPRPRPGGR